MQVLTAKTAMVRCRAVSAGDVVIFYSGDGTYGVAEVYFHAKVGDELLSCISPWGLLQWTYVLPCQMHCV